MTQERVSIVMATYNRAATLRRAIDSVVRQDYPFWELIVVDDGSTDDTNDVLRGYDDPRIIVVHHDENRGVTAAKNIGLDHMSGEWFTFVDSDDEILPDGLSAMLAVTDVHPHVDAVTCNCVDAVMNRFTGFGLDNEGFIDLRAVMMTRGAHWGITRTSLLGSLLFDDRIAGQEGIVWLKISARATRYYINRGLKIYHLEGDDRVSHTQRSRERRDATSLFVAQDGEYLTLLKTFAPETYARTVFAIVLAAVAAGERATAWRFLCRYRGSIARRAFLFSTCILGSGWLDVVFRTRGWLSGSKERLGRVVERQAA
jgi:glycosyltransferase involved in cell wall biosynthesis